jgi:hypothetical protein
VTPFMSAAPGSIGSSAMTILEARILLDQIERLERVHDLLAEESDVSGYFQILAHNVLREAIDYLLELREQRLAKNQ